MVVDESQDEAQYKETTAMRKWNGQAEGAGLLQRRDGISSALSICALLLVMIWDIGKMRGVILCVVCMNLDGHEEEGSGRNWRSCWRL